MGRSAAVALVALVLAQSESQPYAGTWVAEINGTTFVRLELSVSDGRLEGRLGAGNFQVDANGEVVRGSASREPEPISDITLRDSTLSFSRKDGANTDRFELRLAADGSARLTLVLNADDLESLAADGIPAPKPIRLNRVMRYRVDPQRLNLQRPGADSFNRRL